MVKYGEKIYLSHITSHHVLWTKIIYDLLLCPHHINSYLMNYFCWNLLQLYWFCIMFSRVIYHFWLAQRPAADVWFCCLTLVSTWRFHHRVLDMNLIGRHHHRVMQQRISSVCIHQETIYSCLCFNQDWFWDVSMVLSSLCWYHACHSDYEKNNNNSNPEYV